MLSCPPRRPTNLDLKYREEAFCKRLFSFPIKDRCVNKITVHHYAEMKLIHTV